MSMAGAPPPRGRMIDIGGRSLRLVCEGPVSDRPSVLLEAGAFGFAADFGAVQEALTQAGYRSCAYDRAGMGYSDPSPEPRDGAAVQRDLEAVLDAAGERGPFILAGHSMAGLRLRLFAAARPDAVAGVILMDAATPEVSQHPGAQKFLNTFAAASDWAARGASLGLFKPLKSTRLGDKIGLPPTASSEKRWAFASGRHNRTAAAEVRAWRAAAAQAGETPPYRPEWPIAVLTAGAVGPGNAEWKAAQAAPAKAAVRAYVRHVHGASHNTMLGRAHAHEVVTAVRFILGETAR